MAGNQPFVMHAKPVDHHTAELFLSPCKHMDGATKHFGEDVEPHCFVWVFLDDFKQRALYT